MYKLTRECIGHSSAVNAVRFTDDGNYAMTCSDDRSVKLFNPHRDDPKHHKQALLIKSYAGNHSYAIHDIAIAHDNSKFIAAGNDRNMFYCDVATGNVIRRIHGHNQKVNAVALNRDATILLSASDDKTLKAWDLRSNLRDPIQTMDQFKDSVTCIDQTASCIAAGCVDGYARIFDLRSGYLHADNLQEPITSIHFTPNEKAVLSMCIGGYLRLIDLDSGILIQEYAGAHQHASFKLEAVVSQDSNQVICGSEDSRIVVYDFLSGNTVQKVAIEASSSGSNVVSKRVNHHVTALSYHPKLPMVLASATDAIVRCYTTDST
jgi:mitogen-activated protein kinase organizer 1